MIPSGQEFSQFLSLEHFCVTCLTTLTSTVDHNLYHACSVVRFLTRSVVQSTVERFLVLKRSCWWSSLVELISIVNWLVEMISAANWPVEMKLFEECLVGLKTLENKNKFKSI